MKKVRHLLVCLLVACFLCNNIVFAEDDNLVTTDEVTMAIEDTATVATEDFGENQVNLDAENAIVTVEEGKEEETIAPVVDEVEEKENDLQEETASQEIVENDDEVQDNNEQSEQEVSEEQTTEQQPSVDEEKETEEVVEENNEEEVEETTDEMDTEEVEIEEVVEEEIHNPDDDFLLSYVEQPYDIRTLRHDNIPASGVTNIKDGELPAYYSLKDLGLMTGVRNQGSYGTCWAFASVASAESSVLKKKLASNADLSELHLAYYTYNKVNDPLGLTKGDYTKSNTVSSSNIFNAGGDIQMASVILAGGVGFVDESVLPYGNAASIMNGNKPNSSIAYGRNHYLLSNARWIDLEERDYAKQIIMEHGAIATSYYESSSYYNSKTGAYYCGSSKTTNHGITIVGWNDNYSKSNFSSTPAGNGAWLVKNSWGSSSRSGGYFWISYYDANINGFGVQFEVDQMDDLKSIYQYDGSGIVSYLQFTVNNVKVANTYTAADDELLEKVGFFSGDSYVNYNIKVYLGGTEGNPTSGQLVSNTPGTTVFGGYRTVDLNKPVYLSKGTQFSIVVELSAPNRKTVGIITDSSSSNNYYSYHNECAMGQSYYQYSGRTTWTDMSNTGRTARIKAYTFSTNMKFESSALTIFVGEQGQCNVKANGSFTYTSLDPSVATVDNNGCVTALKEGTTTIVATDSNGLSCSCIVSVKNPFIFEGTKLIAYQGNLKSIAIPEGTVEIGEAVFKGMSMEKVDLPLSLSVIGDYSFADNKLTDISLTKNITYVGAGAYQGNELKTVTIEGEKTFGEGAIVVTETTQMNLAEDDWLDAEAVKPTCTETGHSEGHYYKYLPEINDFTTIGALGHCFENYRYDDNATCSSYGTETAKCERCTEINVRMSTTIGSHVINQKQVSGMKFDYCSVCKQVYGSEGQVFVNVKPKTDSSAAMKLINVGENEKATIKNTRSTLIATGTEISVEKENGQVINYIFYVSGDVNGDGAVNSLDYVNVKNYIMKVSAINSQSNILAADYNGDSNVNSLDYVKIKNFIMNGGK